MLPYNRIAIIAFAALVVAACVLADADAHAAGLFVRAVTQNRTMAGCMGVRHAPRGHAGLRRSAPASRAWPAARCRRSATSAPTWARATSSTRSWSWCWAASASSPARSSPRSARHRQQVSRGVVRRGARQDRGAGVHHRVHPEAAAGLFALKGRSAEADGGIGRPRPGRRPTIRGLRRLCAGWTRRLRARGLCVLVPLLNLAVPAGSALHLPDYSVALSARSCATRSWRWRWTWSGATPASCRWATGCSSRSAATRWACT